MKISGMGMGPSMWPGQKTMKNENNGQPRGKDGQHQDRLILSSQAKIQQSQSDVRHKEPAAIEIKAGQYVEDHQSRVDRIKKAVQSNAYHISSEKIASAVMQQASGWRREYSNL